MSHSIDLYCEGALVTTSNPLPVTMTGAGGVTYVLPYDDNYTYAYVSAGKIQTITRASDGKVKTITWTGDDITNISKWV